MKEFTQRNAILATVLNLIINTVAPFILFYKDEFINLKGQSPTLITLLLPTVLISVFATTFVTFVTMTKQRMAHKLEPALDAHAPWLQTALLTSIGLSLAFASLGFGLLWLVQSLLANVELPKLGALLVSGVVGALVAFTASLIAVNRARRIS